MSRLGLGLSLWLALAAVSCGHDRTQIMVGIATDLTAPAEIDFARLRVFRLEGNDTVGFEIAKSAWDLSSTMLPGSLGLYSSTATAIRLRLQLEAYHGFGGASPELVVLREAIVSTAPEATRFLRLGLTKACRDLATPCSGTTTCAEGQCVPREIDVATLPDYPPPDGVADPVTTLACDSGVAYRTVPGGEAMPTLATSCPAAQACREGVCR